MYKCYKCYKYVNKTYIYISVYAQNCLLRKNIKLTFWFKEMYNYRGMAGHIKDLDIRKNSK